MFYCPGCTPNYQPNEGPVASIAWCQRHAPTPASIKQRAANIYKDLDRGQNDDGA